MLFGGGARQGLWSDVVVQLAALPLLAWALFRLRTLQLSGNARRAVILLCAIIALPLIQLVPLPPKIWASLPGRPEITAAYKAAGMTLPWLPLSFDPASTWYALMSLLPPAAVFLAALSLERQRLGALVMLILIVVAVSVPLDLLQMMGGPESSLRFYAITNDDRAVGFFANANHDAALLYSAVPFAAAWAIAVAQGRGEKRSINLLFLLLLIGGIFVALALTRSRAGLILGVLAGLLCFVLVGQSMRGRFARRALVFVAILNLAALLLAFQFGFVGLAQKEHGASLISDIRWPVAKVTTQAALANLPFGTGFGTFVPVYDTFAPRTLLLEDHYVNHAHDDWLELLLTGGIPAALIAGLFLGWFVWSSVLVWRSRPPSGKSVDAALERAASLVIALLLLHSVVDYPLRTAAISVLFAIACAFLAVDRVGGAAAPVKSQSAA